MNNKSNTPSTPNMTTLRAIICGVLTAVFMVYTAIPSNIFAIAVIGIFLLCAFKIRQNGKSFAFTAGITAFCAFLTSLSGLALVLSIASAAAIGSLMLKNKKSASIYLGFTALAYVISAIITSPATACQALIFLPVAVVMAICQNKKVPRVSSVCAISATLIAAFIAPFAIVFLVKHGTEAPAQLKILGEEFFTSQQLLLATQLNELFSELYGELADEISPDIIKTLSDTIAEITLQIIPALLIVCANIAAFVAHSISLSLRRFNEEHLEPKEKLFVLSKVSAWTFIISLALSLLTFSNSQTAQIVSISMLNINIILSISFFFVGLRSVLSVISKFSRRKRVLHVIFAVLSLIYCGSFLMYPLVFVGIVNTLKHPENQRNIPNS